jgi:hypothetical protein
MSLWSSGYDFEAYLGTQAQNRSLLDGLLGCHAGPLAEFYRGSICRCPGLRPLIICLRVEHSRKETGHFSETAKPAWTPARGVSVSCTGSVDPTSAKTERKYHTRPLKWVLAVHLVPPWYQSPWETRSWTSWRSGLSLRSGFCALPRG